MLNSRQKDWIQSQGGALLMIKGDTKKFKKHFDSRRHALQKLGIAFRGSFSTIIEHALFCSRAYFLFLTPE